MNDGNRAASTLPAFQGRSARCRCEDAARGDAATFLWLAEEFGELATAVRAGDQDELAEEMADVLAWLATLANIRGSISRRPCSASTVGVARVVNRFPAQDPAEKP